MTQYISTPPSGGSNLLTPTRPLGSPVRSSLREASFKKSSDIQRSLNFPNDDPNVGGDVALPSVKIDNGGASGKDHFG